jgi:hypothetical protein
MGKRALALGVGAGEDAKLGDALNDPSGDAGRMTRMHLDGTMYLEWLQLIEQKTDSLTAAISKPDESPMPDGSTDRAAQAAANAATSKAQFAAMKAQAKLIDSIDAEMHIDNHGMVVTSQTVLK